MMKQGKKGSLKNIYLKMERGDLKKNKKRKVSCQAYEFSCSFQKI